MTFLTPQLWREGYLVQFHDSNSKKRKAGIVVKAKEAKTYGGGWKYTVLWNSGLMSTHSAWELRSLDEGDRR